MSEQTRPEEVVIQLRPHARALFWPSLLLVVIAGAVPFFQPTLPQGWPQWLLLGGAGLLLLVGVLLPFFSWLGRSYRITTRRIVLRGGLFVRTRQEVLHSRGHDVTVRAAGVQLLFGSGDILIGTGAERPVMLRDVPRAALVQSALTELMEASRNPIAEWRQRPDGG